MGRNPLTGPFCVSSSTRHRAVEESTYDLWVGNSSTATEHAEFKIESKQELE